MGRPSGFTAREDKILMSLAGRPTLIVNGALQASGFQTRTAKAISGRRWYLKQQESGGSHEVPQTEIARLEQRRGSLSIKIQQLTTERSNLIRELDEIGSQLAAAVKKAVEEQPKDTEPA